MSPDGTIAAAHVWKRFRSDSRRPLLRDEVERVFGRRGADDPDRWRWVLREIELHVEPGEAVGLFGTNGSGKSTFLKLLTQIMFPTYGSIDVQGRVGALIEIRAGIHPELTGRENVYMYGSILGLPRATIAKRFDEIVDFAELAEAVDRPVKFYSSGMAMRIGFAVAAFLEPDVLLVDEVMAVGDATFQQKCLDRMGAVIAEGTTVVFVSHDLPTIEAVCRRGIWLHDGIVRADGPVRDALAAYRQEIEEQAVLARPQDGRLAVRDVAVSGADGPPTSHAPLRIRFVVDGDAATEARITVGITEGPATPTVLVGHDVALAAGRSRVSCTIADLPLAGGTYYLWIAVVDGEGRELRGWQPETSFALTGPELDPTPQGVLRLAPVHVDATWSQD